MSLGSGLRILESKKWRRPRHHLTAVRPPTDLPPTESRTAMSRGRGRETNACLTVRKGVTEVTLSAAGLALCNSCRLRYAGRKHNVSESTDSYLSRLKYPIEEHGKPSTRSGSWIENFSRRGISKWRDDAVLDRRRPHFPSTVLGVVLL
jgi:hypothetical protein